MRKLREERGWTQSELAAKLQLIGWEISRESVTHLETGTRRVTDFELFVLATVFGVPSDAFFTSDLRKKIKSLAPSYRVKLSRGQVPPSKA